MNSLILSPYEYAMVFEHFVPGFQPDTRGRWRGSTSYRGGDNPTALAIDLERNAWYDHVLGEGGDSIAFVMRCLDVNFISACKAISDIIGRPLLDAPQPPRPQYSDARLTRAQLFKMGFAWDIERKLELVKEAFFCDLLPDEPERKRIKRLTELLDKVRAWTPYEAARFMIALEGTQPDWVAECVAEAKETELWLATIIAAISTEAAA